MAEGQGIGRNQMLLIGGAVVAVLLLITVPLWVNSSRKANVAEVPLNVDAIKMAEITYHEAFEEYVSAEAAPRAQTAVNDAAVPWTPSSGFVKLAWAPANKEEVYGSYQVVAKETGFTVTGTCDVDGDGKRAVYSATEAEGENAKRTSEEGVY